MTADIVWVVLCLAGSSFFSSSETALSSLPITRLEALSEFYHLVYTADSRQHFIDLLDQALQEHDPEQARRRVAAARENTWDKKVERLKNIMILDKTV